MCVEQSSVYYFLVMNTVYSVHLQHHSIFYWGKYSSAFGFVIVLHYPFQRNSIVIPVYEIIFSSIGKFYTNLISNLIGFPRNVSPTT